MQGYKTLAEMIDEILGYNYQQSSTKETRAKEALNRFYQEIAAAYDWPQLLFADESGLRDPTDSNLRTFEAGESEAPMPIYMGRLKAINLQGVGFSTGQLEALDMQDLFDRAASNKGQTGVPRYYSIVGKTAQLRRLSAVATPTAFSNVTSNNGTKNARVVFRKGAQTNAGYPQPKVLSGTFSTGVSLGVALPTGYPIESVVLDEGWLGNFTITGNATTLVSIQHTVEPETQTSSVREVYTRQLIRVWPVPDVDYAATVMYVRAPRALTEDEDAPEMPVSAYLIERTIAHLLSQEGRHKDASPHTATAASLFAQLTKQNKQDAARRITPRGRSFTGMTGVWD